MNLDWQENIINGMIKEKADTTIGEYIAFIKELELIENTTYATDKKISKLGNNSSRLADRPLHYSQDHYLGSKATVR